MSELALLLLVMVAVVNPAAVALAASVEAAPTQRHFIHPTVDQSIPAAVHRVSVSTQHLLLRSSDHGLEASGELALRRRTASSYRSAG